MKRVIIRTFLIILIVTIAIGLLEIYARLKYYGGNLRHKGFYSRGRKYTAKKQSSVRIICMGASTTHGGDVAPNEAYPFYLEQILNKTFGKGSVEVLNSGMPATPTEYHRDFVKEKIDDQEVDIIVLHSLYNFFGAYYPRHYSPKQDKLVERHGLRTAYIWDKTNLAEVINLFLMEHSYVYTRIREKILTMKGRDINEYYGRRNEFICGKTEKTIYDVSSEKKKKAVLASFLVRYYVALEDIILTAKTRNIDVILIIPPYPFFKEEYVEDIMNFRPNQYYNIVFEKAKQCIIKLGQNYDLLIIDTDSEFLLRGRDADMFLDLIHMSKKGYYILAEIIASKIAPYINSSYSISKNKPYS